MNIRSEKALLVACLLLTVCCAPLEERREVAEETSWPGLESRLQKMTLPYQGGIDGTDGCNRIPDCPLTGSGVCTVSMDASDGLLT